MLCVIFWEGKEWVKTADLHLESLVKFRGSDFKERSFLWWFGFVLTSSTEGLLKVNVENFIIFMLINLYM